MIELFMIGNLAADAVMNDGNPKKNVNFAVCHSETWKNNNKGEKKYWVDCVYYSDDERLVDLLRKGTKVYVKGTPDIGIHINKQNEPVAVQYLKVSKIEILSQARKEKAT